MGLKMRIEERIRELEERVDLLEKRVAALEDGNGIYEEED
jgi:exonuclease VII small subunit